jgi:hypothetical protein
MSMKLIAILAMALATAGCASTGITVTTKPVTQPEFHVALPRAPQSSYVRYRIVDASNVEAFAAEVTKSGASFYVVDGSQMKNLTGNIAELRRYALQMKIVVVAYDTELNRTATKAAKPK